MNLAPKLIAYKLDMDGELTADEVEKFIEDQQIITIEGWRIDGETLYLHPYEDAVYCTGARQALQEALYQWDGAVEAP